MLGLSCARKASDFDGGFGLAALGVGVEEGEERSA